MSRYESGGHVHGGAAVAAGGGGMTIKEGGGRDAHEDDLVMPGFRFHPTEEELIEFYLRRKVEGKRFNVELITFLDLYRYDPWELPAMAAIGEKEWFFYVPRDRKYRNGDRPNRVTASGYWKATGADRMIRAPENNRPIGLKKTLVFYSGKAPKGVRSSWIMNEYRLPTADTDRYHKTEISLCRVYKRTGIDDGHGQHFSARSTIASRGRGTTARQDSKQGSSSTSTPTPPQTPSKLHLLQAGECTSPLVPITDHAQTHRPAPDPRQQQPQQLAAAKPCGGGLGYLQSAAAAAGHQEAAAAFLYQQYSKNTNTFTSTYSLLNLVNAASMGSASAAAIDELSTLVGHGGTQLPSYHSPTAGGHQHDHFVVPLPTPSSQPITPLGTLPMSLAAISDKIWDWNPIPDAATGRDYGNAGFK
ncbi:protein BEARSKIN1-like [Lolium rigidum]|uniref:protein BEARSKIN1-like n=1 Tax=Lolium rigidum TaxID=89674 RepID=UPI001F5CFA9F|nr:protein BEARSKIN1-like [Lolium rigidum]